MTHSATRTIDGTPIGRVEGEGRLRIELHAGAVASVELRIFEPPRFFEALLRGRAYTEPPDITARICGICPVAYQMSACAAIEDACGMTVGGGLAELRRLLYCGEWLESHALHVYMLHAPDFLGYDGAVAMARDHRSDVERGLRLKRLGNRIMEVVGGRAIHPVNVRVGGFYRLPTAGELGELVHELRWALGAAMATVEWVSGFRAPAFEGDWDLIALAEPGAYPSLGRSVQASSGRLDIDAADFLAHVHERHVAHSTALHSSWAGGEYLVGALARYAISHAALPPQAAMAARDAGLGEMCRNPFQSIVVRSVEMMVACEEAMRIIDGYEAPRTPSVQVAPRAGVGHGVSEAPRGLLYHRYELAADGTIASATIVPPTSQNQAAIEHDLRRFAAENSGLDDATLATRCEQLVRCYDPCISCATHFLDVQVLRR
ncbi:MAG: Ni/Fe hydrogenase subunit alpha [Candidatus Dormibacteraeota bacterium]|nr:Ni/Fe hydrogenase subunit alpha [Candidatus Dormibacteraeota bacterium]